MVEVILNFFGPVTDKIPANPRKAVLYGTDWTELNCYKRDEVLYREGPRANGRYCCSCDRGPCCYCGN